MGNTLRVSHKALRGLIQKSREDSRKRAVMPLTSPEYIGFQALYNAIQPGSYVCPHRHDREEAWMPIAGGIALITFDISGDAYDRIELSKKEVEYFLVPENVWHSCFALVPNSIFFNISRGPHNPNKAKEFAPWAPKEDLENPAEGLRYLRVLEEIFSRR